MSRLGVGSPLDAGPVEQLRVRGDKFSEKNRSKETLTYLTSNKPWIRLTSGVNVLSEDEIKEVEANGRLVSRTGSNELAKKTVLGQTNTKGGLQDATGNKTSSNPTYRRSLDLGFRPEPGITSATIRSKGSYGTLRETTVNFVVWTLEDLEDLEKLYLRPGYSMLLEWGHTIYFDNKGVMETKPSVFGESFFNTMSTKDIERRIEELKEKSSYNYDAVYGYIKNYSWSFRKDGGYDCSISIASKGTIIESLRVDISSILNDRIPKKAFSAEGLDDFKEEQKSPFHFFFTKLKSINVGPNDPKQWRDKTDLINRDVKGFSEFKQFVENFPFFVAYKKEYKDDVRVQQWWVPLHTFLSIFNEYIGFQFGDERVEFYVGQGESEKSEYSISNKYVTSEYHFGLDPLICVLPKDNISPLVEKAGVTGNFVSRLFGRSEEERTFFGGTKKTGRLVPVDLNVAKGAVDDILNIYVNVNMIQSVVDSYIDAEQGQLRNALGMIKDVLNKINDNLGGVNDLDIHYEDSTNLHYIVDRKNTPESDINYATLPLTGLRSTVTDLQLSSKLSNQVGTQIAVAAQGVSGNYVENVSELLKWNTGLVDRHTVPSASAVAVGTTEEQRAQTGVTVNDLKRVQKSGTLPTTIAQAETKFEEQVDTFLTRLAKVYQRLRDTKTYDSTSISEMKSFFRTYMSRYVLTQQIEEGKPEKGIVPVELSMTLMGISGLTVAKAFKIARGILPERIVDNFGFIITGLEHDIGTQWTTKIKTQFYALKPSEGVAKSFDDYTRGKGRLPGTVTFDFEDPNFTGATPNADRLRVVLKTLGYQEKQKELSSGGDMSSEAVTAAIAVLSTIKAELPQLNVTLPAGNDLYHQKLNHNSRHKLGNAFDITISPATKVNIDKVETILFRFAAGNDPSFRFLNEYTSPTRAATGQHFHISWGPGTEGNTNIEKAKSLVQQGLIKPITIR